MIADFLFPISDFLPPWLPAEHSVGTKGKWKSEIGNRKCANSAPRLCRGLVGGPQSLAESNEEPAGFLSQFECARCFES